MHALSKKHFYDVMKGSQEDTILEYNSNDENDDVDIEGKTTSDVGCFTRRCHMKSYAVQTQWNRNNKNFRNESTNTSDVPSASDSTPRNSDTSKYFAIHRSLSCEDIAVSRVRSAQTTSPTNNMVYTKKDVYVEALTGVQIQKRGFLQPDNDNRSKCTITDDLCRLSDEAIQHKCPTLEAGHQTEQMCFCHDLVDLPCKRGVTACHAFTLGTTEARRIHNENSRSKLIGGFRVPVCKGHKRF